MEVTLHGNMALNISTLWTISMPSMVRHLVDCMPMKYDWMNRMLVEKSDDALSNPYLIFENVAQVKHLVDSIKYTGPIAIAGDCTKVKV